MSLNNVLGTILKTIEDVQKKNKSNPNEETADKDIFKVLKDKLRDLDTKTKNSRIKKGKSPESILDMIKKEIEGVRKDNRKSTKQKTAPKTVFDNILKKVEEKPRRQASVGLRKIVEDYRLDISNVPPEVIREFRQHYINERKKFDNSIAKGLHKLNQSYSRRRR